MERASSGRSADFQLQGSFRFSQGKRSNPFRTAALKIAEVPPTLSKQEVRVRCELMPLRRGLLRLESISVARADPRVSMDVVPTWHGDGHGGRPSARLLERGRQVASLSHADRPGVDRAYDGIRNSLAA